MANTIANSATGDDFFTMAGVAITATTQPNVLGGAVRGMRTQDVKSLLTNGVVKERDPSLYHSSRMVESTGDGKLGTTKANSAGTFAYWNASHFIIRGVTSTFAGAIDNTQAIRSRGSDFGQRRPIHKVEAVRTRRVATAIRAGYWNPYTGSWTTAPATGEDTNYMGDDHAATPSRQVPGELTYHAGLTGVPTNTEYKEKFLW